VIGCAPLANTGIPVNRRWLASAARPRQASVEEVVLSDLDRLSTEVTGALAAGRHVLLLSDFDGTLSPIVDHPADAWLPRAVGDDLRILAASPRLRVGILSGRTLTDVRARVGISGLVYAGCHGWQIEGLGMTFVHPATAMHRQALADAADDVSRRLGSMAGVLVEVKDFSIAVHYRHVIATNLAAVGAAVDEVVRAQAALTRLHGKKVIEIVPRGWSKGHGATYIHDQLASTIPGGISLVYLGDDATDETVFAKLSQVALTAHVGEATETLARYRLADVEEVHRFIAVLAEDVLSRSETCA